jgi:hypothetical protein
VGLDPNPSPNPSPNPNPTPNPNPNPTPTPNELQVPRGPLRGVLCAGKPATLPDGRLIQPEQVRHLSYHPT